MRRRRVSVIINPTAGRTAQSASADVLRRMFRIHGYDCDVYLTDAPHDAERAAAQYSGGCDLIVCFGGDGTLSEVVNGMARVSSPPPIAYLPYGTTNDFARSLGLSCDIRRTVESALANTTQAVDIGVMNDRRFVYSAAFGAFVRSSYATPQHLKNRLGRLAYLIECIRELPQIRAYHVRAYDDAGNIHEGDYIFGVVSNATSIGGFLHFRPDEVDLCDGCHEVLLIRSPKNAPELYGVVRAVLAGDYAADGIDFFRTSQVRLLFDEEAEWALDGEYCSAGKEVAIRTLGCAMRFVIPTAVPLAS